MLSWTTDQKEMAEKKYIINILHIQVHVYHSFRVKTTFAKHSKQILMQEHSQIFQFIPNITARGISSPYKPVCKKHTAFSYHGVTTARSELKTNLTHILVSFRLYIAVLHYDKNSRRQQS